LTHTITHTCTQLDTVRYTHSGTHN